MPTPLVFFFKIYFIFLIFLAVVSLIAAHGLSLVVGRGGYSLGTCVGFSLQWLLSVEHGL